jgi:Ni,Fe-hydrogenase III small subunit
VDDGGRRTATLDLGKCVFCGLCAETDPAIRMTNLCELAARRPAELRYAAAYRLKADGTHDGLMEAHLPNTGTDASPTRPPAPHHPGDCPVGSASHADAERAESLGRELASRARAILGRSLHIRMVDAGSCNGCEVEISNLNSPVYDLERFGLHFVASPRHADMLLVTGPVTRNMELALRKTYEAMPGPRLVVAVGACGCSGGIFGVNYATRGAVDTVLPVDVYIPGCPPNPHALLHGILTAIGRWNGPG